MDKIRKVFVLNIPEPHKREFDRELIEINYVRTKNLSLAALLVFSFLLFADYLNYTQGLGEETPGYSLLFIIHLLLWTINFALIAYLFFVSRISNSISNRYKQFYITAVSYLGLIGITLVSIAYQYIHGEITVFVLGTFLFAIINYQKPLYNLILYSIAYGIFILGITIVQDNPDVERGQYLHGMGLVVLALFLSRILYSAKVNDFNSRMTIEHQNEELEKANGELSAINQELQAALSAMDESQNMIFSLTLTLEAKDHNTHGHSERVSEYTLALAKQLNLNEKDQTNLWRAAILHDIGKIGIPDAILNKPTSLSQDEWNIMRSHCARGEAICAKLKFAQEILPVIRYHHERYDGQGYPDGLIGQDIPLLARVVSIADSVDAMTSSRRYRTQIKTMEQAIEELQRGSGSQFDPLLVQAFIEVYQSKEVRPISEVPRSTYKIKKAN